jgi:hypothetical protein
MPASSAHASFSVTGLAHTKLATASSQCYGKLWVFSRIDIDNSSVGSYNLPANNTLRNLVSVGSPGSSEGLTSAAKPCCAERKEMPPWSRYPPTPTRPIRIISTAF